MCKVHTIYETKTCLDSFKTGVEYLLEKSYFCFIVIFLSLFREKQTNKEPVATLLIFACMYVSQFSFNGPAGPNR